MTKNAPTVFLLTVEAEKGLSLKNRLEIERASALNKKFLYILPSVLTDGHKGNNNFSGFSPTFLATIGLKPGNKEHSFSSVS